MVPNLEVDSDVFRFPSAQELLECIEGMPVPDRWDWHDSNGESETLFDSGWFLGCCYVGPGWWGWHVHKRVGSASDWNPIMNENSQNVANGDAETLEEAKACAEAACRRRYEIEVAFRRHEAACQP